NRASAYSGVAADRNVRQECPRSGLAVCPGAPSIPIEPLFLDTRRLPLDTSSMSRKIRDLCAVLLAMSIYSLPKLLMAQTNETDATRWLAKADIAPAFVAPASLRAWESRRKQLRAEVWQLLGKLPPRPKRPQVETLSREDRGDYLLEKFQFDNGAGAMVPGYLLLPNK